MSTLQIFGMMFFIGACAWIVARNVIKHIDYRFKEMKEDLNDIRREVNEISKKQLGM